MDYIVATICFLEFAVVLKIYIFNLSELPLNGIVSDHIEYKNLTMIYVRVWALIFGSLLSYLTYRYVINPSANGCYFLL